MFSAGHLYLQEDKTSTDSNMWFPAMTDTYTMYRLQSICLTYSRCNHRHNDAYDNQLIDTMEYCLAIF